MTNVLDFNKLKRKTMTVILADENQTKINVCMPSKKMIDEMQSLQDVDGNNDSLDLVYGMVAKTLSNNLQNKKFTTEEVKELLEFEDVMTYISYLTEFITGVTNEKN